MLRTVNLLLLLAVMAGAGWTFKVKADAEAARQEVARIEERIRAEREALDILKADWSLLTSPARLEKLVERYKEELALEQALPDRFGEAQDIPHPWELPAADPQQPAQSQADAGAENSGDVPRTGSIRKEGQ
jgi:hypothetical protein